MKENWLELVLRAGLSPNSTLARVSNSPVRHDVVINALLRLAAGPWPCMVTAIDAVLEVMRKRGRDLPYRWNRLRHQAALAFWLEDINGIEFSPFNQGMDLEIRYPGSSGCCLGLVLVWAEGCGRLPLRDIGTLDVGLARHANFLQSAFNLSRQISSNGHIANVSIPSDCPSAPASTFNRIFAGRGMTFTTGSDVHGLSNANRNVANVVTDAVAAIGPAWPVALDNTRHGVGSTFILAFAIRERMFDTVSPVGEHAIGLLLAPEGTATM